MGYCSLALSHWFRPLIIITACLYSKCRYQFWIKSAFAEIWDKLVKESQNLGLFHSLTRNSVILLRWQLIFFWSIMSHHDNLITITVWLVLRLVIGIDHDTVCAGVVGTAIRNSTSCAGRCSAACGRAGRHECRSGLQYQPRQRRPYKWSISILPRSQFTKSKGNLRFRRLVPLFVPIGVCVTTHDDGTASDVTIGMWRHNQQVTNHERNGKPCFLLPK